MAATGFEDARRIVREKYAAQGRYAGPGTAYVAPWGWEDMTHWRVVLGAREALVNGDDDFTWLDAPVFLVNKATGGASVVTMIENLDRVQAMRPVGRWPTRLLADRS